VDATIRILIVVVIMAAGFFLPGLAQAAGQNKSCQFTLNIPNLNVYPSSTRFRGDDEIDGKSRIELEARIQHSDDNKGKKTTGLRLDLDVKIAEFKGDGTTFKGHQAFWLLDPWFVGGNADKVRGCLDNLYKECVKAFGPSALSKAHLKAQCSRAAQWRVSDSFNANAGDNNTKWITYKKKKAKLVNSVECLSDTDGKVTGKLGCRNISFRRNIKINVVFGQDKLRR